MELVDLQIQREEMNLNNSTFGVINHQQALHQKAAYHHHTLHQTAAYPEQKSAKMWSSLSPLDSISSSASTTHARNDRAAAIAMALSVISSRPDCNLAAEPSGFLALTPALCWAWVIQG